MVFLIEIDKEDVDATSVQAVHETIEAVLKEAGFKDTLKVLGIAAMNDADRVGLTEAPATK